MELKAVHKTDPESAGSILKNGFDLQMFGSATAKTGMTRHFRSHPLGIYLTEDEGHFRPEDHASHPWDHRKRGALVFCTVILNRPLLVGLRIDGEFYQEWLSKKYGGLAGKKLTDAIIKDGHDGIFCRESGEIIAFSPRQIKIDVEKTKASIDMSFKEWLFDIDLDD